MTRALVALTYRCNNACVFCGQDGAEPDGEDVCAALRRAARTHREVTFVGGEPTEDPRLPDAVAEAAAMQFEAIGVQTNARSLDLPRLRAVGLTDVHLSIHGANAAMHDYHTGVEGSFAAIERALEAADGVTVVATTMLTRSSFRSLGELPAWLHRRGVAAWVLAVPHVAGRAADRFDRVVPRLGLALPYALHAAMRARAHGLPTALRGAPICGLGPHAGLALAPDRPRTHADVCRDCAARPRCVGVDPAYVQRYTADELHPVDDPPGPPALPPALARMFVGAGTLARRPIEPHEPPAQIRRRLPVLGRPRAGTTEVRGRKPTKDARDLFPDLFDDE